MDDINLFENKETQSEKLVGWFGFYGISTFVGNFMPNPFSYI